VLVAGTDRSVKKAVLEKGTATGGITAIATIAATFICKAVKELNGQELAVTTAIAAILGTVWNIVKPLLKSD